MGEAKRRREKTPHDLAMDKLVKELADKGLLVESGWIALRSVWLHPDSPPEQVRDLRWAFMAGAQHTFSMMLASLDSGEEPTEADMLRMEKLSAELDRFHDEMGRALPTEGRS